MARTRTSSQIQFTGPFFRNDPGKTLRQNIRVMVDRVAAEGEADVIQQLRQGEGRRAPIRRLGDRVSDHAVGRTSNLSGRRWAVSAVVSVNNRGFSKAQGTSLMAAASSVERRTHAFRKTATRLRKARAVNVAELLRGIA